MQYGTRRRLTRSSWGRAALGRCSERLHGPDANDSRNRRILEAMISLAQELFDGLGIETTADLLRRRDGEAEAGEFS